jgi:hypothetical protein
VAVVDADALLLDHPGQRGDVSRRDRLQNGLGERPVVARRERVAGGEDPGAGTEERGQRERPDRDARESP